MERAISAFDFSNGDNREYEKLNREYTRLKRLTGAWNELQENTRQLADNRELLASADDPDFQELIHSDIDALEERNHVLDNELKTLILPAHPNEGKDLIVEIRPAAGGDEAGLFAGDLFRMYMRYCETKGWRTSVIEQSDGALGGIKSVSFTVSGDEAWSILHFESGVHRVQRVPETEAQGRVHTSTVTVAVMAEAEEVDFELNPEDLRIDVFRSSGHGGQCVNTTDSAVRVTHIPTGTVVTCQDERSQLMNKRRALATLEARLKEREQKAAAADYVKERDAQVKDRSNAVRRYDLDKNVLKDMRTGECVPLKEAMRGRIEPLVLSVARRGL